MLYCGFIPPKECSTQFVVQILAENPRISGSSSEVKTAAMHGESAVILYGTAYMNACRQMNPCHNMINYLLQRTFIRS